LNLMEISTDGRSVTVRGQKYLQRHVDTSKWRSGRD
jgi:hypothetical protein